MQRATIDNLKKAVEVLTSSHVSSVEVGFEYETDNARYYTAITRKGLEMHRYKVKVHFIDGERYVKCQCHAGAAGMMCRHIIKVAQVDSDTFGIALYTPTLDQYKAYTHYRRAA